jgi:hypothetical protein
MPQRSRDMNRTTMTKGDLSSTSNSFTHLATFRAATSPALVILCNDFIQLSNVDLVRCTLLCRTSAALSSQLQPDTSRKTRYILLQNVIPHSIIFLTWFESNINAADLVHSIWYYWYSSCVYLSLNAIFTVKTIYKFTAQATVSIYVQLWHQLNTNIT